MAVINVIGDSHVSVFGGKNTIIEEYPTVIHNNVFSIYRLGAPIAYNINKPNTFYKCKEKIENILYRLRPNSKILFVFGEIDCRYHILNQAEKLGEHYINVVRNTVVKYLDGIRDLDQNRFDIGVWGPIPSTKLGEDRSNRDRPIKGNCWERNKVTRVFNADLKLLCSDYGFKFFTIFDKLVYDEFNTRKEFYMDDIHLSQLTMPMILKELKGFYEDN